MASSLRLTERLTDKLNAEKNLEHIWVEKKEAIIKDGDGAEEK